MRPAMLHDPTSETLDDLAVLADPVRRRLYLHVTAQADAVSRDAAAAALTIGRPLAAHHLDRLVEAGQASRGRIVLDIAGPVDAAEN